MRLCSARPTAILLFLIAPFSWCGAQESTSPSADTASETQSATTGDPLQELQSEATKAKAAQWGHWGNRSDKYDGWGQHSNRLVPVYTFGITLDKLREQGSVYRDAERLRSLYGSVPEGSVNPTACYFDQTNVYDLQMAAVEAGYSNIILMVFDGMDWQTTRAASLYKTGRVGYDRGRGTGLSFQDYSRVRTDFGLIVTSPRLSGSKTDVDSQTVLDGDQPATGGYHPILGGNYPSREISAGDYLIGKNRLAPHSVTDSAASASSM
ncbi:MAG: alkaline phosphatase, partial [Planctomycetota bacterium]